jgi:large subunit ribosomal protein L15
MKYHELQVVKPKAGKRVGRGIAAGQGKTAGRGTKGQNSRTGGGVRVGFEGGQNPLAKRLPKKRGFRSLNPITFQVVNVSTLEQFKAGTKVDATLLAEAGCVKSATDRIKVLSDGELTKKLDITVNAVSTAAKKKIQAVGGTITLVEFSTKRTPKTSKPQTT